jgi:hypothetical protein|tara:strand:+ start:1040 stop:1243 length:204 start_codon:yes stop_codon:yes gene_type:complete
VKIVKGRLDSGLNRRNGWMKGNDIYGWVVIVADQLNYAEMYAREPVFFNRKNGSIWWRKIKKIRLFN